MQGSYWCNATYSLNNLQNGATNQGPCIDTTLRNVFRLQRLSTLEDPSRTIWAADASGGRRRSAFSWELGGALTVGVTTDTAYPGRIYLLDGTKTNNGIVGWHLDMANILWCDGHVKAFPPSKLVDYAGSGTKRVPRYFTVAAD
jgi:prepilin-type processing-associated H-X9-DG protein